MYEFTRRIDASASLLFHWKEQKPLQPPSKTQAKRLRIRVSSQSKPLKEFFHKSQQHFENMEHAFLKAYGGLRPLPHMVDDVMVPHTQTPGLGVLAS